MIDHPDRKSCCRCAGIGLILVTSADGSFLYWQSCPECHGKQQVERKPRKESKEKP